MVQLGQEQVAQAIDFFRAGKAPGFDAEGELTALSSACGTRHDLIRVFVELQLRVAAGEPLPIRQEELSIDGWAFEARLYAEDAERGFLRRQTYLSLVNFVDPFLLGRHRFTTERRRAP